MIKPIIVPVRRQIRDLRARQMDDIRRLGDRTPPLAPAKIHMVERTVARYSAGLARLANGNRRDFSRCAVCSETIHCGTQYARTTHGPMHLSCYDLAIFAFRALAPDDGFSGTEQIADCNS